MSVNRLDRASVMPNIRSEDSVTAALVMDLFRSAGQADAQSFLKEFVRRTDALVSTGTDSLAGVAIEYHGGRIGFRYEGPIPPLFVGDYTNTVLPKPGFYVETNERYSTDTAAMLGSVAGVTHYLGILGGVDGMLAQLGILEHSNALLRATCVDGNAMQMFYGMAKIMRFEISPTNAINGQDVFPALANTRAHPQSGIMIDLSLSDIRSTIEHISEEGRYFIYLSNVFDMPIFLQGSSVASALKGWHGPAITGEMLNAIMQNQAILDGSYVLFAGGMGRNDETALLVRKERGSFILSQFVPRPDGARIDVLSQQVFIDQLVALVSGRRNYI